MSLTSCEQVADVQPETNAQGAARLGDFTNVQFDAAKFGKSIEAYMTNKVAGFGYTVFHDGKLVAGGGGGWARKPFETNSMKHGYQIRQGIASSTKFVTALATVAVLEKHNIPLKSPVYPYLPVTWKPSDAFKEITFERLLAHKTGLVNYKTEWPGWKKAVEELTVASNVRDYDNVNYSLMAIILAYVDIKKNKVFSYQQLLNFESGADNWYTNGSLGNRFRSLVRRHVFEAAGLEHWNKVDYTSWNNFGVISPKLGTMGYPSVFGQEPGTPKADLRINGGAGGLYISTFEYGQVQNAVAQGKIVSEANYKQMKTERLGFDGIVNGARGSYYWKNGGADNMETMIFDMGRTQICVFANSGLSEIGNDPTIIANAYDGAWGPPAK